jgi:malate dehydrogenase (oxaloacetate-decarboxylating)
MFLAAARTIAGLSPAKNDPRANLLPPLAEIRKVSLAVAISVAKQAESEGLAHHVPNRDFTEAITSLMWDPVYATYRRSQLAHRR